MNQNNLDNYCRFFEQLQIARLPQINQLFTEDALFQDPFNRVRGHAAIRRIFEHLLQEQPNTRFRVTEQLMQHNTAYLRWTFEPDPEGPLCIEGVSRVQFAADGRVTEHRDYWDSASELFAQLPITGPPMRWLLRHAQACATDQLPVNQA